MTTNRTSISKGTRFDIFRRDSFTCQYCGRRPPDVVLELDHIHPISKGGTNDAMNLVTSCADCNRGKGAKVLAKRVPRPDADLAWLEMQQEIAELKRYNEARAERDAVLDEVRESLRNHWVKTFDVDWVPVDTMIIQWINTFGPREVEVAINIATAKWNQSHHSMSDSRLIHYVAGIMWKRLKGQNDAENEGS